QQTGYSINYASSRADQQRKISKQYTNARLADVIRGVWGDDAIKLEAQGKTIDLLIVKKPKKRGKGDLKGTLLDENAQPVPFATVAIKGTNIGVSTNASGQFEMMGLPAGTHTLAISSIGYVPTEARITIRQNETTSTTIEVPVSVQALQEVIGEGQAQEVKELVASAQAVTVVETRVAKVQTADLGEVMARTQGVNIQRSGGLGSSAQFSLNGLTNDQIRFFLNGIPLDAMGYINGLANVPVNLIDRVEIYRGVVPIRFGADALGGAVNIISNGNFDGTGGSASYQLGSFGTHRLAANFNHRPIGKTLFINFAGFYDRARNNYKIDVEVPDARGRLTAQTVERFHDDYLARGGNLEFGFHNKPWADKLTVRGFYSAIDQDIQHNFVMTVPYGGLTTGGSSLGGLLKWEKSWENKLSIENTVGLAYNEREILDTATVIYKWDGELARDLGGDIIRRSPGERGRPSDVTFQDRRFYDRFYLQYRLNPQHQLRLSSAPTFEARGGENALIGEDVVDRLTLDNQLFTFISGVEYEYTALGDKLSFLGFAKSYVQHLTTDRVDNGGQIFESDRKTSNYGAGASLRYNLNDQWQIKASYERATRLTNLFEVFGDGLFITANLDLRPERSHNANLSAKFKNTYASKASLDVETNLFLRQVEDLIQLLGTDEFFLHANIADVASRGVELTSRWTSGDQKARLEASGTYISYVNNSNTGPYAAFDGDRLPNRPYFFGSASGSYSFKQLTTNHDELVAFINSRFVNQFFRSWESVGRRDSKQVIPSQFTQNIGLTYNTLKNSRRLSFTAELQNIFNVKVFDFFGVQRPGRAFYVKSIFNF
ncbi:MAG: TonB-dependent receptor, partial [Bacteroidota bacterium]